MLTCPPFFYPRLLRSSAMSNRYSFFNGASSIGKILIIFLYGLTFFLVISQFCQVLFSANDSEEMPERTKPYIPFGMAFIDVLQGVLIFQLKELMGNVRKFDRSIQTQPTKEDLSTDDTVRNYLLIQNSDDTPSSPPPPSRLERVASVAASVIETASVFTKPVSTYFLSAYEVKLLLSDSLLLSWEANSLRVVTIKHVLATIATLYDSGTENAATIKKLIKSFFPNYYAQTSTSESKRRCSNCCNTDPITKLFAILGAFGHASTEGFALCLFLISLNLSIPVAATLSSISGMATGVQNYAFQGREFQQYLNKALSRLLGTSATLNKKTRYGELAEPEKTLTTKQKLLLALLNLAIFVLVTTPSAISHYILARLTLADGGEAFWRYWLDGKELSVEQKQLVDTLSKIGAVPPMLGDALTESIETHINLTKAAKQKLQTPANDTETDFSRLRC